MDSISVDASKAPFSNHPRQHCELAVTCFLVLNLKQFCHSAALKNNTARLKVEVKGCGICEINTFNSV